MKVAYLIKNAGIASRTPEGWRSVVLAADREGSYTSEQTDEVADADVFVVGLEPVDDHLLAAAPNLRLVQRLGVGVSNVDLEAAARRGVPVCNMPDFNAATVAEHAIMLMLCVMRRVFDSTLAMKAGHWPLGSVVAGGLFDLIGKRVGIVGLGAIGGAVADRLQPFETDLVGYDRDDSARPEVARLPLGELLRTSDVVTLHTPLTRDTRGLLGSQEIGTMKAGAILINTARGALVDEQALALALNEGRLGGAGVDVFAEEPPDPRHPLRRCPNVLLTPHVAGQTREAMERMVAAMLRNLERVASGEDPLYRVAARQSAPQGAA